MLESRSEAGFTLVELILAMAIFSFGLLIILVGFIALLGFYQNGTQNRVVQTAARTGINQIVLSGRQSGWFAYDTANGGVVCMSTGKMFYVDTTNYKLMQAQWPTTTYCNASKAVIGTAVPVTTTDAQVVSLVPEPADKYNATTATPCTSATIDPVTGLCTALEQHNSLRVTLKVTSSINNLNSPANTSCKPTAPSYCVIATLSTTLTAGEF